MPDLIMLRGLPAAGKSSWAKQHVLEQPVNSVKRVNKDDLRAMLDAGRYSKGAEELVLQVRDYIAESALLKGQHVIVDDTNLDPKHERRLRMLCNQNPKWNFKIKDFHVELSEAIARDEQRANPCGAKVITDMYNRYVKQATPVKHQPLRERDLGKEACIVVDMDGTLARMENRHWTEFDKVDTDVVQEFVADIVNTYYRRRDPDVRIIIVSGREEKYRGKTTKWLRDNGIPFDQILMRVTGDHRKDFIIKREIFEQAIDPHYNVLFALDDRDQVVKMWRDELHIPCLQVYYGDF